MFKALVLKDSQSGISGSFQNLDDESLPGGDVTIAAKYSTLNYKDGLILGGLGNLVRSYPHVPGVDVAGVVVETATKDFVLGDEVIVGGNRFGEIHWGGYSEIVRVPASWVVKVPPGITMKQSMIFGTAGFSAMLAVMALEEHGLAVSDRPVLVTGAVGGVGSIAVALLSSLGYKVAASTGRQSEQGYLEALGASNIVDRSNFDQEVVKPLEKETWSGCIDNVGGRAMGVIISQMARNSSIASVGLAGGSKFSADVMPFLLRGINLLGIDSVSVSIERRIAAWQRLADIFPIKLLESLHSEISLEQVLEYGPKILSGLVKGRVLIRI